jgi:hypothetical protein
MSGFLSCARVYLGSLQTKVLSTGRPTSTFSMRTGPLDPPIHAQMLKKSPSALTGAPNHAPTASLAPVHDSRSFRGPVPRYQTSNAYRTCHIADARDVIVEELGIWGQGWKDLVVGRHVFNLGG